MKNFNFNRRTYSHMIRAENHILRAKKNHNEILKDKEIAKLDDIYQYIMGLRQKLEKRARKPKKIKLKKAA